MSDSDTTACAECNAVTDLVSCAPPVPDEQPITLCEPCAVKQGFCPSCGWFVAGVEWDDMHMNSYGVCAECVDMLREETGEYDE